MVGSGKEKTRLIKESQKVAPGQNITRLNRTKEDWTGLNRINRTYQDCNTSIFNKNWIKNPQQTAYKKAALVQP